MPPLPDQIQQRPGHPRSYQTAWALLHRLRSVLVRPGRDRLAGMVEIDETYIGGEESGLPGGRARGKKVLTGIAVEIREPRGFGRCRMLPLADASAASLHPFVTDHVEPGATIITDGWQGYRGLEKLGYVHDRRSQRAARARGEDPGELLPVVHRVASLAKRWLLGTHQGSVDDAHLASYLNEFVFRFNRRRSRSRGMVFYRVLELAVAHDPVRYQDLIATKRPRAVLPTPPQARGHPPSLERPRARLADDREGFSRAQADRDIVDRTDRSCVRRERHRQALNLEKRLCHQLERYSPNTLRKRSEISPKVT